MISIDKIKGISGLLLICLIRSDLALAVTRRVTGTCFSTYYLLGSISLRVLVVASISTTRLLGVRFVVSLESGIINSLNSL